MIKVAAMMPYHFRRFLRILSPSVSFLSTAIFGLVHPNIIRTLHVHMLKSDAIISQEGRVSIARAMYPYLRWSVSSQVSHSSSMFLDQSKAPSSRTR
jgi:hypothetical protein